DTTRRSAACPPCHRLVISSLPFGKTNHLRSHIVADKPFLTDIKTLRERARKHIENGAVTEGYNADRDTVVKLLNEALATEIVCVLRYKRHYFMATVIHADSVAAEYVSLANAEQGHDDQIAERIVP